jgi:ankyrin repeat protein
VKRSSLIQLCRKTFGSDDFERVRDIALCLSYEGRRSINELILSHPARRLYLLIERYKREFPRGTRRRDAIPTPIVCACERGRMDDVELFMNLHPFHKYITNRDVNGYRDDMILKDMVSQVGRSIGGYEFTPLMTAAHYEHFQIVKYYLIEQGEADPNIASSDGQNALHWAAGFNRMNTELIELLLTHMSLDSINKKDWAEYTPLDYAYYNNRSPIRQEIIALLRSKGGKANEFDQNGRYVGGGNGDLNH